MRGFLCLASMTLVFGSVGLSQERRPGPVQLQTGRENLSRAASSAADLKAIADQRCWSDGGVEEVEMAKDATGHGQIVSDSDLDRSGDLAALNGCAISLGGDGPVHATVTLFLS